MTIENYEVLKEMFKNMSSNDAIDVIAILNENVNNPDVNVILLQTLKELIYISKVEADKTV